MKIIITCIAIAFCSFMFIEPQEWIMPQTHFIQQNPESKAQLIIFYLAENQLFIKETLPKIKKYCAEKKIELIEKNASDGLPSEITSTPALVFQNDRGRSIYAARYTEFSTIENFIRTSRAFSKSEATNCKKDILAYQNGRMKVAASIKITPLSGSVPSGFNISLFEKNAKNSINIAMQLFDYQSEICLNKTDRVYYLDFHPFVDKDGKLFLSYELYSQFSCTVPVLSKIKTPLEGTLANSEILFAQIAKNLEAEIIAQLESSKIGDAYTPILKTIQNKTWLELGLENTSNKTTNDKKLDFLEGKLLKNWNYAGPIDSETPALAFHFQEPLDRYAGEVKQIRGKIELNDNQQLSEGRFEVNTSSLTMGIADFDKKVHDKYIRVKRFPTATFSFKQKNIDLAFGKTTDVAIVGDFTLMGKTIPMTMQTQLTPTIGIKGEQLIVVQATFSLNITDDFGIKGPDGPDPAKKTMQFFMNFFCSENI